MDLVKAEVKTNSPVLYSLIGYTQAASAPAGSAKEAQDMMVKLQSMSPEARRKMIEELRKKSGDASH